MMFRYRRIKKEVTLSQVHHTDSLERKETDPFNEVSEGLGTSSRFISTSLNLKHNRPLHTEILPQLELLIARKSCEKRTSPRLIYTQDTPPLHFGMPKRATTNQPKNYAEYVETHKKRKSIDEEAMKEALARQRHRGNTIIICQTVDPRRWEDPALKISPVKKEERQSLSIDLPEIDRRPSFPNRDFKATLTGVRKELQQKLSNFAESETAPINPQPSRRRMKFFGTPSLPSKSSCKTHQILAQDIEHCAPWLIEEDTTESSEWT